MIRTLGKFAAGLALVASAAGAGIFFVGVGTAGAATTFTVDTTLDSSGVTGPSCAAGNDGACTLREAISEAESVTAGNSVIDIPTAGTYTITDGVITIDDPGQSITIDGAGQDAVQISGEANSEIFEIESNYANATTVAIDGVTLTNANTDDTGGAIYNDGILSLSGTTVSGNTSSDAGGGIYSDNTLSLTDSTISGNTSGEWGGGIANDGNVSLTDSTVSGNTAEGGDGGGIDNQCDDCDPNAHITGSTISGNAAEYGGGIAQDGEGSLYVADSSVTGNTSSYEGGGIFAANYPVQGTFDGDTISGNTTGGDGGGVATEVQGSFTFSQSTISGNTANDGGGGFYLNTYYGGVTSLIASTISGNNAAGTTAETADAYLPGYGGGILSDGCNDISMTNDTVASNQASEYGGGYDAADCYPGEEPEAVHAHQASAASRAHDATGDDTTGATLLYNTFAGNTAGNAGAGNNIEQDDESTVTLTNGIVADGPPQNCYIAEGATFNSGGYNLIDDSTCGTSATGDIIGQPAQLGALQNNGGPTNTQLPTSTSPAVGAVPASVCTAAGITTDQRGVTRPSGQNGTCTIGAVEVGLTYNPNGYRLVADEGGIFDFGLNFDGSLANNHLNAPIIGIANAPGYDGYVMAGSDGGVFALGGANFYGSLGGQAIPSPISAIAAPPSENGYWLVAQNGKIYNYGSAPALPAVQLPAGAHIVGMASTSDGQGGWLTDQFGDVYAEGDAQYVGGLGGVHLNKPIVGIAAAASGQGYVLAASDGGIFNYGTQGFFGSVPGSLKPGQSLVAPIVGIAVTHSGNGYWLAGADGGVFNYGDAPFLGSIYTAIPGKKLNGPIVGIQHLGSASS
jgi:predicted outer membrane repeat protein